MTLIEDMQSRIRLCLSPIVGDATAFALIDYPNHGNVGDNAIWLGELAYLQAAFNVVPSYVCEADRCDYERLAGRFNDSLILLHGGGNFGDLWPWFHSRREALLERFVGRHIVQLPQTLKFESRTSLERTARIIARHGNFDLLVRDQASYDLAIASFDCRVTLCPDMAFCLGAIARLKMPERDVLLLLREDKEGVNGVREAGRTPLAFDALAADWETDIRVARAGLKLIAAARTVGRQPMSVVDEDAFRGEYFRRLASARFDRGLRLLCSGRFLVTDRLHAYILSLLLDIPRSVIDNSYGKLSGFINTWMPENDSDKVFKTLDEAVAALPLAPTTRISLEGSR